MVNAESKDDLKSIDEEDEWQLYASAGYATSEVTSEDEAEEESTSEEIWFDGDDFDFEGNTVNWDSPPCPAPLGIAHIIKIGACDFCLNRISGKRIQGSDTTPGSTIRKEAFERDEKLESSIAQDYCPLCEELFEDIDNIVERVFQTLSETQFSTMQFGIHLPKDLIQEEDRIRSKFGAQGSYPLKGAIVEAIHKRIRELGQQVDFVKEKPDVMVLVDGLTLRVDVDVRPVFLYGRYRKISRGIPQTRWPCRACRGRSLGCESCEGTGLQYPNSVQDLIGEPVREALDGEDTSFHGMGREDIDVRCLGSGRPFVLEIKRPTRRDFDLKELISLINNNAEGNVEIENLEWCSKKKINEVKQSRSEKTYTIRFRLQSIDLEDIEGSLLSLSGKLIDQETPKRVSHRRAAKIRRRRIISVSKVSVDGDEVELTLRCEAGTYVKELIHSDEGRTKPSVQGVLGVECEVIWLDVEEIHD
ncbi:MAG: tRNA pseudouridine(54/55) synthase Pus10 [Euryarchaeota archaeon]|nr:tRNA pseudouridine(54/55) synthase Pus10 [Euryarchaeota archaeon]OUW22241.1 MAG: tRNA pseudouridine(54/55) synthase Pus10 [Euryarchaeota archaeon TMED173]